MKEYLDMGKLPAKNQCCSAHTCRSEFHGVVHLRFPMNGARCLLPGASVGVDSSESMKKSSSLPSFLRRFRALTTVCFLGLITFVLVGCDQKEKPWEFTKYGKQWVLLRNGSPFYIKGGAAWGYDHLEELVAAGGNAIRAVPDKKGLYWAEKLGVAVLVNLPVRGEREGLDWDNEEEVAEQKKKVLDIVEGFKDHPAVMMWSVGNELGWVRNKPSGEKVDPHPELWQRVNDIAREVKQIDPVHPVAVCIIDVRNRDKIQKFAADCPDIDILGVNAYSKIFSEGQPIEEYWGKPFFFSEWSIDGHWETPRTEWEGRTELSSSEKAALISYRYENAILRNTNCVGSFVFFWGERLERTHTYWGLFRDGLKTESVDVLQRHWTGLWPDNRAPAVTRLWVEGHNDPMDIRLNPGGEYQAGVDCSDPDHDSLEVALNIRSEVFKQFKGYAGRREEWAKPIPNLILHEEATSVRFKAPSDSGAYRLFVQVTDGHGNAGYANVCFYVNEKPL